MLTRKMTFAGLVMGNIFVFAFGVTELPDLITATYFSGVALWIHWFCNRQEAS